MENMATIRDDREAKGLLAEVAALKAMIRRLFDDEAKGHLAEVAALKAMIRRLFDDEYIDQYIAKIGDPFLQECREAAREGTP